MIRESPALRLAQQPTETKDYEALVFPHDFDRGPQDHEHQDDRKYRRKDEFLSRHASHSSDRQGALRE